MSKQKKMQETLKDFDEIIKEVRIIAIQLRKNAGDQEKVRSLAYKLEGLL